MSTKASTPMKPVKVKRADPPIPDRGPTPENLFDLFAEAHKMYPGEWVLVAHYRSSHGYRIKRAIERGEIQVPGGGDAWEVKAVGEPNDDNYGRIETDLYARRIRR